MLSLLFAISASAAPQQPATLDVPVYRDSAFGVSLPRPFDDWVFEPASSRGTTTVIFHPRDASLREQLWGALVLTTFNRDVPLGQVADQRVLTSWQASLGPSFTLLTRDSIAVLGLPAIHVVMGGTIDHAVLDVEEYLVARGGDLILLQFRYPRGLPRDSIAAGYQRVFDGIRVRGAPGERVPPVRAVDRARAERTAMWQALRDSPWRLRGYDAQLTYDTAQPRLDVAARLELVNDGIEPRDSATLWLPPFLAADSARSGPGRSVGLGPGPAQRVALGVIVAPQGEAAVIVYYHLTPDRIGPARNVVLSGDEALVLQDWIPRVQSLTDSAGQYAPVARAGQTLRFDIPLARRAVAPGRLASEAMALGRRRMTWVADDVAAGTTGFAIANYVVSSRDSGRLRMRFYVRDRRHGSGGVSGVVSDSLAGIVARGWFFYSRAFGRLGTFDISIVEAPVEGVRGAPGLLFAGPAWGFLVDSAGRAPPLSRDLVLRELARSWWGGSIAAEGPGSTWITDAFPAWAAIAARGVMEGDSVRQRLVREAEAAWHLAAGGRDGPPLAGFAPEGDSSLALLMAKGAAAMEAARRAAGEARFREAILTFAAENRSGWARLAELFPLLGPEGAAVLQPYLFGPQRR